MLCQTVGILPAVPGDQIITFSPNRCFTVEITQQKCHLFFGCCMGHLFPLIEKRLFFILPPAHVYRIVPDISCTDTKCTTRFPVMIIVCPAQQQIFCFTGCGGSASSTVAASSTASSAAASAAAEGGQTFKVGIVNYVDHASLNQIVESVESRLDELGAEKGVTFDYADYYANAQADQSNLNQIGADLVGDGVDVIVAVATPTAATMLAAVEDTDIPVVYSAVTDPAAAGFDGEENITGTSDALNTEAIMKLITAVNPDIDTIGLLYDLSQDASTQAIADAKAFCDANGIKYIEKNGTTTAEVQMAAEALIAAGVKAVFTPTDNTVMTAELSIYETFTEAGVQHYTGADSFALNGAFVGYGVDYVQLGEATADMVAELLCEGKTTADLPYQTFDNGIVTINTETCEALGLDLDTVKEAFKPYCTEIVEVTTAENFS